MYISSFIIFTTIITENYSSTTQVQDQLHQLNQWNRKTLNLDYSLNSSTCCCIRSNLNIEYGIDVISSLFRRALVTQ